MPPVRVLSEFFGSIGGKILFDALIKSGCKLETRTDGRDAIQQRPYDGFRLRSEFEIESTRIGRDHVWVQNTIGHTVLQAFCPFIPQRLFRPVVLINHSGYIPFAYNITNEYHSNPCESKLRRRVRGCAAFMPNLDPLCVDYDVWINYKVKSPGVVKISMRSEPGGIEFFPAIDAMVKVGDLNWTPYFYVGIIPDPVNDAFGMSHKRTLPLQVLTVHAPTACVPIPDGVT